MSIFGKIKDAIFGKAHATEAPAPTIDSTQSPGTPAQTPAPDTSYGRSGGGSAPVIDVENHLDSMPGADHLNW